MQMTIYNNQLYDLVEGWLPIHPSDKEDERSFRVNIEHLHSPIS